MKEVVNILMILLVRGVSWHLIYKSVIQILPSDIKSEISSDCSGGGVRWLRGSEHLCCWNYRNDNVEEIRVSRSASHVPHFEKVRLKIRTYDAASGDGSKALPDHAADWARHHSGDHSREKCLLGEICVVGLKEIARRGVKLQGLELESL
jgi:hypothetical protein